MKKFWAVLLTFILFAGCLSIWMLSSPRGRACDLDEELSSASDEGIVGQDVDASDGSDTSMSCRLLIPGPHLKVTPRNQASADDIRRANAVLSVARGALMKYKDYRVAEADGYVPFHLNVPQQEYHFTNWSNARENLYSFDPVRPTSLIYSKDGDGFKLDGVMYTAPRWFSTAQLDQRFPVNVDPWHLHVNLCLPPDGDNREMLGKNPRFGLRGSISTEEACEDAGGTFKPVVYNWMVHVDLFAQLKPE